MRGKGNDGKGNVPERDSWKTSQELWSYLNKQYGFTFDCCADRNNNKTVLYSNNFLGVTQEDLRGHVCWMNPPFSKAKQMFEHFFKVVEDGVAIYRIDNPETRIWQETIFPECSWVFVPKGRVSYTPFDVVLMGGAGSRFPSALIGLNVPRPIGLKGVALECVKNRI